MHHLELCWIDANASSRLYEWKCKGETVAPLQKDLRKKARNKIINKAQNMPISIHQSIQYVTYYPHNSVLQCFKETLKNILDTYTYHLF